MSDRFELDTLTHDPELVALAATAEDVFSFLNRQVTVPAGCDCLVRRGAGAALVVPAGGLIESAKITELLFVRTAPFELSYDIDGLRSKDGYAFAAAASLTVSPIAERTELEAFRRTVLGSGREVRPARLQQRCFEAVQTALAAFASERTAEALADPSSWPAFDAVLAKHAEQVCFESGLKLGADARVSFSSPAYHQAMREQEAAEQREERMRQEAARRAAAAQARQAHLTEMSEMLSRVKTLADESGVLSVPELIKSFDAAQRGILYEGLIASAKPPRATQSILIVAGSELLWFDPTNPSEPTRRQKISKAEAGPLRSVRVVGQGERQRLLIGARHGVHMANRDGEVICTCLFPDKPDVRGGVNSAAMMGRSIFATHSEVGLTQWRLDANDGVKQTTRRLTEFTMGCKAVRDVQAEAGRLWLSIDNLVVGWIPDQDGSEIAIQTGGEVTAMILADGYVTVGLRDGAVLRWATNDATGRPEMIRSATGAIVRSLSWLSGGGIGRLLIGDGRQHLDLHVLGDSYRGEYRCLHELRWGFGAEDLIVGVSDRRDNLLLWNVGQPQSPYAGIGVRRLTGRSIQDVALLPA